MTEKPEKPASERSQKVTQRRETTRRRRAQLDVAFREQLLNELGGQDLPISTLAVVDVAASAYAEISAVASRFSRCIAREEEMARLNGARSQLLRCLKLLALPRRRESPAAPTIEDLMRESRAQRLRAAGDVAERPEETDETS